jgi:hypothetical protein
MAGHRVLCAGVATCLFVAWAAGAFAQTPAQAAPPPASPADVASLDAIMTAVYDVISGPAGQLRNSFQLLKDGDRWWIVTIYWDSERPDNPIPPEYLPRR